MYRIALINMPCAAADLPSIALTQLKSIVKKEFGDSVEVKIFYLNIDFVNFLGLEMYEIISNSVQANTSGLGDWFFKPEAFPEMADDPDTYLSRHFSEHREQLEFFRSHLLQKRGSTGDFLEELIDRDGLDQFDLVGFTSMFSQNLASFALARRLKARKPNIVTVVGGANCETSMGKVIARQIESIDFVFSGPSLITFPHFLRELMNDGAGAHKIPGVYSRKKLALDLMGAGGQIGEELDIDVEVPLDYDDYLDQLDSKLDLAPGDLEPKIPFETSRGCWWGERSHCTFCGLNGMTMKYRAMSPEMALRSLHELFRRYSDRASEFKSVDNILPRNYLTDVLPQLETPEGVSLFYEVKADLKEHEMEIMANAGVTRIQPGIESIATSTLKLMRKGTTSFQNIKFLKYCQRYGITAFWNLLVGFPSEKEDVYKKYCDDMVLLVHLQPPSGAYPVRFDRFSPYHSQATEIGLKLKPSEFYSMIYPFDADELENLAYFFADQNYNADYIQAAARWLGKMRERVEYWKTRWHQRDELLKPELYLKRRGAAAVVYDSRSGRAVEHRLGASGERILRALSGQQKLSRLAPKLEMSESELERQVTVFRQRGLVFAEGDLYMSLVMGDDEEAAPLLRPSEETVTEQFDFA